MAIKGLKLQLMFCKTFIRFMSPRFSLNVKWEQEFKIAICLESHLSMVNYFQVTRSQFTMCFKWRITSIYCLRRNHILIMKGCDVRPLTLSDNGYDNIEYDITVWFIRSEIILKMLVYIGPLETAGAGLTLFRLQWKWMPVPRRSSVPMI